MFKTIAIFFIFLFGTAWGSWGQEPHFRRAQIRVHPYPETSSIYGEVTYSFQVGTAPDSLYFNAVNMDFAGIWVNDKIVSYTYNGKELRVQAPTKSGWHTIKMKYSATPVQSLYFVGWERQNWDSAQIWTQGQGKYTAHWVPSFNDMTQKVEFDLSVEFPVGYTVLANGKLKKVSAENGMALWEYDMQRPMSSYLLAFVIGKFNKITATTRSGIPLQLYYPEGCDSPAQRAYKNTTELFDFLEQEIGFPYPWEIYKQVPVRDFMYAGMENTGLTLFSETYLVDEIGEQDQSYFEINAHELAHQWFGNLVTETNASEHWLHEGFATFYAALAAEHFFGKDHLTWKFYNTAQQLKNLDKQGGGTSLLDPKSESLIFYEKGAWALFALREQVGTESFKRGIVEYLRQYAFKNATVNQFLEVMEAASNQSLMGFKHNWLDSTTFPIDIALNLLTKRLPSIKFLQNFETSTSRNNRPLEEWESAWQKEDSPEYKAAFIQAFKAKLPKEIILNAIASNNVEIQKAVLASGIDPQTWLGEKMMHYLNAKSYEVRYETLLNYWINFSEKRVALLQNISKNGSLRSVRLQQLWWTLALLTENYGNSDQKMEYLAALQNTTTPSFHWEIRYHAFQLLSELKTLNTQNIMDMIRATEHHAWQFKLYCRRLLDEQFQEHPDSEFWQPFIKLFSKSSFPYFYTKYTSL